MSPIDRVLNQIQSVTGREPVRSGKGFKCLCPAHDDHNPSLSVCEGNDGRVLINCLSQGCDFENITTALGLETSDFFPDDGSKLFGKTSQATFVAPPSAKRESRAFESSKATIDSLERQLGKRSAAWDYHDATGKRVCVVVRWDITKQSEHGPEPAKEFRPITLQPDGKWQIKAMELPRLLYRLPQLLANSQDTVFVFEGEKSADAAVSIGLLAITSSGGAKSAEQTDWTPLAGRSVVLSPDNDQPGREHVQKVVDILLALEPPAKVRIIDLKDDWVALPVGGDIADWCDAHDAVEPTTLKARIEALATRATPLQPVPRSTSNAVLQVPRALANDWPSPPDEAAFHGLAGEIVRRIEPHSEADLVALLISLLMAFGNLIGRTAHFMAEGCPHYCNLFACLIGATSKGRKGSSWSQIRRLCEKFVADWAATRILKGLSSGEGFIHAVRDQVIEQQPIKESGRVVDYENVIIDQGVDDKRLLVIEEEFASVLSVASRDGNILSPRVREAWDGATLRTMTKNPVSATGAHISILGHVTRDELRTKLTSNDQSNGFGNRFLWLCVKRSKCLPDGGRIDDVDFSDLVKRLDDARHFAVTVGVVERDAEAREFWHRIYEPLSDGKPGLVGAMLGRAEAQVMRLAVIYALLDRSFQVRLVHLQAALALWDYCERSTKHVFGSSLGNKVADDILAQLQAVAPQGLTRTEINNSFKRNRSAAEINAAFVLLSDAGLAHAVVEPTSGRWTERWFYGPATK